MATKSPIYNRKTQPQSLAKQLDTPNLPLTGDIEMNDQTQTQTQDNNASTPFPMGAWAPVQVDKVLLAMVAGKTVRVKWGTMNIPLPYPDAAYGEICRSDSAFAEADPRAWTYKDVALASMHSTTTAYLLSRLGGGVVKGSKQPGKGGDGEGRKFINYPTLEAATKGLSYTPPVFPGSWAELWELLGATATRVTPAAKLRAMVEGFGAVFDAYRDEAGKLEARMQACLYAIERLVSECRGDIPSDSRLASFLANPVFDNANRTALYAKLSTFLVTPGDEGEPCPWLAFADMILETELLGAVQVSEAMQNAYALYLASLETGSDGDEAEGLEF